MPASESILIPEKKPFAPVDTAIKLYKKVFAVCIKMPKRYTFFGLQQTVELAGSVMDNAKRANSVFAKNDHEKQIRIDYWIMARADLQALSTRIDRFTDAYGTLSYKDEHSGRTKGVTIKELGEIADLINSEMTNLTNVIQRERN